MYQVPQSVDHRFLFVTGAHLIHTMYVNENISIFNLCYVKAIVITPIFLVIRLHEYIQLVISFTMCLFETMYKLLNLAYNALLPSIQTMFVHAYKLCIEMSYKHLIKMSIFITI